MCKMTASEHTAIKVLYLTLFSEKKSFTVVIALALLLALTFSLSHSFHYGKTRTVGKMQVIHKSHPQTSLSLAELMVNHCPFLFSAHRITN